MGFIKNVKNVILGIVTAIAALAAGGIMAVMLCWSVLHVGNPLSTVQVEVPKTE